MEVVYLGIISKIFNAVFNAILSPVFKFLSSLLEIVLGWLFNSVLKPLLVNVFEPLLKSLLELVMEILAEIIYSLYAECLKIIDAMQTAFNVFSGIQQVTYENGTDKYTLLELLFRLDSVQKGVMVIMAVSLALMFLFAVLGTVRSVLDLDGGNQRPVSKVLSSTMKAFFKMLLIPMASLFAIMMSGYILVAVHTALGADQAALSKMVFVVSSLDACKEAKYNISGKVKDSDKAVETVDNIGTGDEVRKQYYTGSKSYADVKQVKGDFNLARFDYLIGFGGAVFLIIVLAVSMVTFVTRIIEVLLLFIVSPFFAAVMPLDDGEKFKSWQDMFVAKLFGGYGTVAAMEIYMMICPRVMDGKISFGMGSTEANYLIRLIFLLGGAWATIKSGPVITQLLNAQAGGAEAETVRSVTAGMAGAAAVTGAAAMSAAGSIKQTYQAYKQNKNAALSESNMRIANRLNGGGSGPGTGGGAGGSGPRTGGGSAAGATAGMSSGQSGTSVGTSGNLPGASSGTSGNLPGTSSGTSGSLSGVSSGTSGSQPGTSSGTPTASGGSGTIKRGPGQARRVGTFFNGRVTLNKTEGGNSYLGVNFGKFARFGRDENGRFHARFLGFGIRKGADGKVDKVSLPFLNLKKDQAGNRRVTKVNLGVAKWKRAEQVSRDADGRETRTFGDMYWSDFSPINMKRRFDNDTGKTEMQDILGVHYRKNSNNEYVKTHRNLFGVRTEYEQAPDGTTREAARIGNFTESTYSYGADGERRTDTLSSLRNRDEDESRHGGLQYRRDREEGEQ